MKKYLKFLSAAVLMVSLVVISACSDDEGGKKQEVKITPIKRITFDPSWGDFNTYDFTYDVEGRVATMVRVEGDNDPVTSTFNYSVANQLTITRSSGSTTVYDLDSEGRIIKEYWNEEKTNWEAYEYNAHGFMVKITERYEGVDYLKYTAETDSKNVLEHLRYDDDGEVERTKVFNFNGLASAINVNGIHQTTIKETDWQWVGGFLGKASYGLVDNLQYWDTGDEENKKTTEIDYTFEGDLMTSMTRVGSDFTEEYTFTYYEDEE